MFTLGAIIAGAIIVGLLVNWSKGKDRATYDRLNDEQVRRTLLLHTRRDVKLIAFLLFAILIMLGIIADRIS
jgi:hypothetical protein